MKLRIRIKIKKSISCCREINRPTLDDDINKGTHSILADEIIACKIT